MAADDSEMLVSCGRHLSDLCGVCSKAAPILSIFPLLSTKCFLADFLSGRDPVHGCLLCLELSSQDIYNEMFSNTF
jgi:hypothetical protein